MKGFERYAIRLLLSMSMEEARQALGFPSGYVPDPDEINKAYKRKAIENHPDRGGSHEKMVEVNVAKEILEGKRTRDRTPYKAPEKSPEEIRREKAAQKLREDLKTLDLEERDVAGYLKFAFMRSAPDFTDAGHKLDIKEFLTDDFAAAIDKINDESDARERKNEGLKVYEAMSRDYDTDIQKAFKTLSKADPNAKKMAESFYHWWKEHKTDIIPYSEQRALAMAAQSGIEVPNSMWDAMKSELTKMAPEVNEDWEGVAKLCQSLTSKALRLANKFGAYQKRRVALHAASLADGVTLSEMGSLVQEATKFVADWKTLTAESGKLVQFIRTSEGLPNHWDDVYSRSHNILAEFNRGFKGVTDSDFKDFEGQLKTSIKTVDKVLADYDEKAPPEADWRTPGDYQWATKVIQAARPKTARTADVEPSKEPKTRKPRKKVTRDTVLLRIEKGDYHALPFDDVKANERPIIKELVSDGLIKLMEPKGKFPERYVLTSKGSHAIRTFNAKLIARVANRYMTARVAARFKAATTA